MQVEMAKIWPVTKIASHGDSKYRILRMIQSEMQVFITLYLNIRTLKMDISNICYDNNITNFASCIKKKLKKCF